MGGERKPNKGKNKGGLEGRDRARRGAATGPHVKNKKGRRGVNGVPKKKGLGGRGPKEVGSSKTPHGGPPSQGPHRRKSMGPQRPKDHHKRPQPDRPNMQGSHQKHKRAAKKKAKQQGQSNQSYYDEMCQQAKTRKEQYKVINNFKTSEQHSLVNTHTQMRTNIYAHRNSHTHTHTHTHTRTHCTHTHMHTHAYTHTHTHTHIHTHTHANTQTSLRKHTHVLHTHTHTHTGSKTRG